MVCVYIIMYNHSNAITIIPGRGLGEKEVHTDTFHHILFGGDLLTAKRARGSQYTRSNSLRGKERLEGLKPVIEDWHAKVCLLGVRYFSACTIQSSIHVLYMTHLAMYDGTYCTVCEPLNHCNNNNNYKRPLVLHS